MNIVVSRRNSRAGSVLALVLLAILGTVVVGLAIRHRVYGLHRRVSDDGLRAMATTLAEAALEEAHHVTSRDANQVDGVGGSAIFDRFRVWGDEGSGSQRGTAGFTLAINIPRTRELLTSRAYSVHGFKVDVESRVLSQKGVLRANERSGRLAHKVTITAASGRVVKEVERRYDFRVAMTSAMRPFDRPTLLLQDARGFFQGTGPDGLAKVGAILARLHESSDEDRTRTVEALRQTSQAQAQDAASAATGATDAPTPRPTPAPLDPAILESLAPQAEAGAGAAALAGRLAALEAQKFLVATHSLDQPGVEWSLSQMDWWSAAKSDLEVAAGAAQGLKTDLEAARTAAESARSSSASGSEEGASAPDLKTVAEKAVASAQAFEAAAATAVQTLNALTQPYIIFGSARQANKEELERSFELLHPDAWKARAEYKVLAADTTQSDGTITDFLKRRGHPERPFSGILLWDNPGRPLNLSGLHLSGKLVIIATGDVVARDVRRADSNSLLTVVALGKLDVGGTVQASLFGSAELNVSADARIEGNLLSRGTPGIQGGTVAYDRRFYAGPTPVDPAQEKAPARRHYHVAITPGPVEILSRS